MTRCHCRQVRHGRAADAAEAVRQVREVHRSGLGGGVNVVDVDRRAAVADVAGKVLRAPGPGPREKR